MLSMPDYLIFFFSFTTRLAVNHLKLQSAAHCQIHFWISASHPVEIMSRRASARKSTLVSAAGADLPIIIS
jgi:hypothetical protein